MKRLSYLINHKSNIKIIIKYLSDSLGSLFEKKKRKEFVTNYRKFLETKSLTQDWFSHNSFDWKTILKDFKNKEFDYLEIGSFEGNSAMFILENFLHAKISCVDPWSQFTKGHENLSIKEIEENFDNNLKDYQGRFIKFKKESNQFFLDNTKEFDLIYVDGLHHAKNVFEDCSEAWNILKKEGVMIIDDYFWIGYENPLEDPINGINKFLDNLIDEYLILRISKYPIVFIRELQESSQ